MSCGMKTSLTSGNLRGCELRSLRRDVDSRRAGPSRSPGRRSARQAQVEHRVHQPPDWKYAVRCGSSVRRRAPHALHVLVAAGPVAFSSGSPARTRCAGRSCWCRSTRSPASRRCSRRSCPDPPAATTSRISSSTRCTSCDVTSSRVPDGALRLITNWPASVRGKNATPEQRVQQQARRETRRATSPKHGRRPRRVRCPPARL